MAHGLTLFNGLLAEEGIHPVLVDVGASGGPPGIWNAISAQSIYVGFDPDLRELTESSKRFYQEFMVNVALTNDANKREVLLYLTRFPQCSSTLRPNLKSLSEFHYREFFMTEQEVTVSASTLDSVLERLSLDRVDWLKCDTQGIDLRIFTSLSDSVRSKILALDIEPGLIDAYEGEDLFVDAHRHLPSEGFWLSNLDVYGAVRVRKSTLEAIIPDESTRKFLADRVLKKSPGWCEARYLRTLDWLDQSQCLPGEYVLLWIFALLDGQISFALDVSLAYERRFGANEHSRTMRTEAGQRIKKLAHQVNKGNLRSLMRRAVGR